MYAQGCFIYPNNDLSLASPLTSISSSLVVRLSSFLAIRLTLVLAVVYRVGSIPYYRSLIDVAVGWDIGRV